jgi:hypothetical protein
MTFREMGWEIGDKVRFVDDRPGETRTIETEAQLDYNHDLPWFLVAKAKPIQALSAR